MNTEAPGVVDSWQCSIGCVNKHAVGRTRHRSATTTTCRFTQGYNMRLITRAREMKEVKLLVS
jgi:hypothetical protein